MIKRMDVERLLQWVYCDELTKRPARSLSAWWPLLKWAQLRTWVDERSDGRNWMPAILGAPHPDALIVAAAVEELRKPAAPVVVIYASMRTRPDWMPEPVRVLPVRDESSKGAREGRVRIVGECLGKNRYALGSYCPLRFEPPLHAIEDARAEYTLWHSGLTRLAGDLAGELAEHEALLPRAAAAPWITGESPGRVLYAA